jgi:hypothetical protein
MAMTWRRIVEAATVRLVGTSGQGVLVHGGFVLTAAHCIQWSGTGGMAMGDIYPQPVVVPDGTEFNLCLAAADPVSDMAALWGMDGQECTEDCERFEEWCERTIPVLLLSRKSLLEVDESCDVSILTHEHNWLKGTVTRYGPPGQMPGSGYALQASGIKSGDSGGPVVNARGELVGVISWSGTSDYGAIPVARQALPSWLARRITRG